MTRRIPGLLTAFFVQFLAVVPVVGAQTGLSQAVLALPSSVIGSLRFVDGRLYGGTVDATITDADGNPQNFGGSDVISFAIGPRGQAPTLFFNGTRASIDGGDSFEDWTRRNADALLAILFPASLASGVLGRSPGELHAQELLLTTALDTDDVRRPGTGGRYGAGGLFEYETLRRAGRLNGDSGSALQGLYGFSPTMSVQGRFVEQREFFSTRAVTASFDYHPFVEVDKSIRWRFGGTARSGFVYSSSSAMDLGSLEFGGGGWVSGFKDLGRVRVGGATMLQGWRSYIPPVFGGGDNDSLGFVADAINARGIQDDLAYGGTAGVDATRNSAVIVKLLQNVPLSARDARTDSWLLMTGLSYRFGLTSLNGGYKHYSTAGLYSHALFLQGNFNW